LPADGSGAKLADFGIAKGVRDAMAGLTATGQILGTPRYLAPEQVAGESATPRSDLYAAGVLCYELLAGTPPFEGEHAIAVALMHQHETPPPLRDARPDAPAHVVAALERAMAKDPAARFADAGEMRTALRSPAAAAATTQVLPAAATTQVLPAGAGLPPTQTMGSTQAIRSTETAATAPRRGVPAGAVLAAVLLLGLLAAALALRGGDELPVAGEPTSAPEEAAEPDVAQPVEADPEPEPEPEPEPVMEETEEPRPSTPEELLALLDRDPEAYGEKGEDLRDDLADLLDKKPKDQPKEARKLIEEAEKWAREGDLDPAMAELTAVVLGPMAQEEERDGGGSGAGPPDEDVDDEDDD
jgi:eukaryotic-like serine/threonine-protein kinase